MQGNNNKKSGVLNALRENEEIETKTSSEIMQVKYIWFVVIWNGVSKGFFFREIVNREQVAHGCSGGKHNHVWL